MNRKAFSSAIILFFSAFLYLGVIPVFPEISFFDVTDKCKIIYLKDYYTAISPCMTFFLSLIGIMFGFYYYYDKNKIEESHKKSERYNKFFDLILYRINSIGIATFDILNKNYAGTTGLNGLRSRLIYDDNDLETLLEIAVKKYGWVNKDFRPILCLRSYISNQRLISESSHEDLVRFDEITKSLLENVRLQLDQAKQSCYFKIENLYG